MNAVFETVLSLSIAGSICIGVLFLLRRVMPSAARSGALYYVWLIVIARLLIPWSPAPGPAGDLVSLAVQDTARPAVVTSESSAPAPKENVQHAPTQMQNEIAPNIGFLISCTGCVWLGVACVLFFRRVISYTREVKSLSAESEPAPAALAQRVREIAEEMGTAGRVHIRVFRAARSPMLIGLLRPQLFVPSTMLHGTDLSGVIRHELVHARRLDILYKWMVQAAVCVHWFNPLVRLMARRVSRDCELSCDAAVMRDMSREERLTYGDTLLRAAGCGEVPRRNAPGALLTESGAALQERLTEIMEHKQHTVRRCVAALAAALILLCSAAAAGAYTEPAAASQPRATSASTLDTARWAGEFYDRDNPAGFSMLFPRLSFLQQLYWLNRSYRDGEITFFSIAVDVLESSGRLPARMAERAYADGQTAFFSVLAGHMNRSEQERWLEKAASDGNWAVCSLLLDRLDKKEELDALEEALWEEQLAAYRAVGIETDGRAYYYKGERVNVFLDVRADSSCYTLSTDPAGTINILVERDTTGQILGVFKMSDQAALEILEDLGNENVNRTSASGPAAFLRTDAADGIPESGKLRTAILLPTKLVCSTLENR